MSFVSVRTRENFSPARNVRSTTAPLSRLFTFVRTNAPPLPGLTCWNSTMRQTPPSISTCMPFLNWLVLMISATDSSLANHHEFFREGREHLGRALGDDDKILDAEPAQIRDVDAGLDGDDVAGSQEGWPFDVQPRRLVHLEAESVPESVP